MVARPEESQWSNHGINAWGGSSWLQPHEEYLHLGQKNSERCHAYRELFRNQLSEEDMHVVARRFITVNQSVTIAFASNLNNNMASRSGE